MERPTLKQQLSMLALSTSLFAGCTQLPQWAHNPFSDPIKDREMRFSYAQVIEQDGSLHKAEQAYRQLQKEAPKNAKYTHRLGVTLVREGRAEEGLVELRKAADLKPEDVAILNDLGYALVMTGEYEEAETVLKSALKFDQRNPRTINNLALAMGYEGKSQDAYELFRRNGSEAEARSNLAYVLAQRGEMEPAVREYNLALSKDPSHRPAAEALVQLTDMQKELQTMDPDVQYAGATAQDGIQQVTHRAAVIKGSSERRDTLSRQTPTISQNSQPVMTDLVELVQQLEDAEEILPEDSVPPRDAPRVSGPMGIWMTAPAK
ncbi:tetratricopeptide repeat protein [bacterium]|nr:tetratricopeptide repeat protein [bacterium]